MAFVKEDPQSVDLVQTYADEALTTLVEDLTSGVQTIGTGEFLADEMDPALYTFGTIYWLLVRWTPVGGQQITDSWPFLLKRIAQPSGAAPASGTDCRGFHVQTPSISLRIGRNTDAYLLLENAVYGDAYRHAAQFSMPEDRQAEDMHFVYSSCRAGAPLVAEYFVVDGAAQPIFGAPDESEPPSNIRIAPRRGYRATALDDQHLLSRSLNINIDADFPTSRPGYQVHVVPDASRSDIGYSELLVCDTVTGLRCHAYHVADKIFDENLNTIQALASDPYLSADAPMPRSALIRGSRVWCDGIEHWTLHRDGVTGMAVSKLPLTEPLNPAAAPLAGGTLPDGDRYVRIRWKDASTDTKSGPNSRTGTVTPVALANPNNAIQVDRPAFPARATHWQIQSAPLDTPESYEIHYTPKDGVGGSVVSDATGWIPVATASAILDEPPVSGDFFEFLKSGNITLYRHALPPAGADHVVHYKGRAVYASSTATWLVWSDSDNPEHHYANPFNPYEGFNTQRAEDLVDSIVSPCRCLASTIDQILYFSDAQVVIFAGTLQPVINQAGELAGRDFRNDPIGENTLGAEAADWIAVNEDIFYVSPAGPSIYRAGRTALLDPHAIEVDWNCRDRLHARRTVVGYDPLSRLVLFSYVSLGGHLDGVPTRTLAYSLEKNEWCAPWTLPATSWSLTRTQSAAADALGVRLFCGGPYGAINLFGDGWGDGDDGSDPVAEDLVSTGDTSTSVTVAGAGWIVDAYRHWSLVLTDRQSGQRHYRTVRSNTDDTLEFEGAVSHTGSGWLINLAGYESAIHTALSSPGAPFRLDNNRILIRDQVQE